MARKEQFLYAMIVNSGGQLLFLNCYEPLKEGGICLPGIVVVSDESLEDKIQRLKTYLVEVLGLFLMDYKVVQDQDDFQETGTGLLLWKCTVKGKVGKDQDADAGDEVGSRFNHYGYKSFVYLTPEEAQLISFRTELGDFIQNSINLNKHGKL